MAIRSWLAELPVYVERQENHHPGHEIGAPAPCRLLGQFVMLCALSEGFQPWHREKRSCKFSPHMIDDSPAIIISSAQTLSLEHRGAPQQKP